MAFKGASGSRTPGWGGEKPGSIPPANHSLCLKSGFQRATRALIAGLSRYVTLQTPTPTKHMRLTKHITLMATASVCPYPRYKSIGPNTVVPILRPISLQALKQHIIFEFRRLWSNC